MQRPLRNPTMNKLSLLPALITATLWLGLLSAQGHETVFTDSEGQTAYLYTPSEKPEAGKVYWLAIGVHGMGGDGKGACGIASWAKDDVIVLGPSFTSPKRDDKTPKGDGPPPDRYQMNGPAHDAKLKALIQEVGKTWKLRPKVFLHGFSAGAQFAHRFTLKNPDQVAGVSAASAGSWNSGPASVLNPAAASIPFAVSCGEYDQNKSSPNSRLTRLEWMKEFAEGIRQAHFDAESRVIANTGHKPTNDTMALAQACFLRARALNFSRSVMLAFDFNTENPLWSFSAEAKQEPKGKATTAVASWVANAGVIEKQGTTERTGALRFSVNSAAKSQAWTAKMRTGLLPVHCPDADINNLTLAFDLSATSAKPVQVTIESFDGNHKRTGGRQGWVYPAAPGDFQRQVLDLGKLRPSGEGAFKATDPVVEISLTLSSDFGWATGAFHQLTIDNLSYAASALFVSPSGSDKNDGFSASKPLATVSKALFRSQPGDIICLMDGTFEDKWCIADFKRGGSPAAWITLRNQPGQRPILKSQDWNIVKIGMGNKDKPSSDPALAYLEVRGLVIHGLAEEVEAKYKDDVGKPKSTTNGNGLSVDGRFQSQKPHHIRIADNEVLQCSGGGISVIHADCVQIENNHAHHN